MKTLILKLVAVIAFVTASCGNKNISQSKREETGVDKNIYGLSVKSMEGENKNLSDYKGKTLLIVNVASNCGYTPQYEGLERIYEKYKGNGFEILAFPCNDFGGQEPGTNDDIKNFCKTNYNVTFPLFDKIKVLGDEKSPLYEKLISSFEPKTDVKWNFEKFLIDKNGDIVSRFGSKIKPESTELISAIEGELGK